MTEKDPGVYTTGSGLNIAKAEVAIRDLPRAALNRDQLVVDLSRCEHVDPGAGWRFGAALKLAASKAELIVRVPETRQFSGDWFRNFTRSGLGFAISRYASQVESEGRSISEEFHEYYERGHARRGRLSQFGVREENVWSGANFLLVNGLSERSMDPDEEVVFRQQFEEALTLIGFSELPYKQGIVEVLARLVFESVQNVYDHAAKSTTGRLPLFSYFSLKHYAGINFPKSASQSFDKYLRRVVETPAMEIDFKGFLEIVVLDDGVGIGGRHLLDEGIYSRDIAEESTVVLDALAPGRSVKIRSQDTAVRGEPGYGSVRMLAALKELKAFALVRTGRLGLHHDSIEGAQEFKISEEPLAYFPGTALQFVFPRAEARVWEDLK